MGKHFIVVYQGEDECRELEPGLILKVKNGIATVTHNGSEIFGTYTKNLAVIYVVSKKETFALNLYPPMRNEDVVGWLIGIFRKKRAHSNREFKEILEANREKYKFDKYKEDVFEGDNFIIVQSNRDDGKGIHNVASYIKSTITNEEVLDLVPLMVFPLRYIQFVLQKRFGIDPEDVKKVYNEWNDNYLYKE